MANLRDKLRDQPPEKPSKSGAKPRATGAKGKSKRVSKAAPKASLGEGLEVNRKLMYAAIGIALLAGLLVMNYLSDAKSGILKGAQTVKVYVPSEDLPARKQLDSSNVTSKEFPRALLPDGALTDEKDVMGKITNAPVVKGEILHKKRVEDASAATGLAPKLHPSERGFLFVPEGANDIALVKPDDYVDLTATIESADHRQISTKVVQRARILSVGNRFNNAAAVTGQDGASSNYGDLLTIAVPSDKVALLAALKQQGNLSLSLREPTDTTITPPEVPEDQLERAVMGHVAVDAPRPVVQPRVVVKERPVIVHVQSRPRPVVHPHVAPPPQHDGVEIYHGTTLVQKK